MKRILAVLLSLVLLIPFAAFGENAQRKELTVTDYLAAQAETDAMLMEESKAGYGFDAPLVIVNPYGNAPLSAVAIFTTEEALGGTVTVKGKAAEDNICGSFNAATEHFVPIYGLYAGDTTQVELALEDGRTTLLEVKADSVVLGLSDYSAATLDAALYDYGTLTICGNMILRCYAGYDSKGDLRWALTDTGTNAITQMDNGHFLIPNQYGHGAEFPNGMTGIREIDPMGKVYNTYVWDGGEHHEIIVLPNGNYMVTGSRPGYRTNRDYVFEIDSATGEVVWDLDMAAVITPGSSGCESDQGQDWCHNNALAYDEATDTLLISCRHLCAVVAVKKETKELKWIFGDPAGWAEEYQPYLLKAADENTTWSYGQHQLTLLENGDLLLFDNGEFGRVKAVNADKALKNEENYSRAVIYRIDEAAMSVSQVWAYGESLGARCYASSMSGIQCLDEKAERYLITFGTCVDEDGTVAAHIQLIEKDVPVWELNYRGSSTYRGYRYSLYTGEGYVPGVRGQWHGDIGVTGRITGAEADPAAAEAGPEGVSIALYPFDAIRFFGGFVVEDEALLTKYAVALVAEDGTQYCYDLGYIRAKLENGFRVTPSRWVSLKGLPAGRYGICIVMNGTTYDTAKDVIVP